MSMKSRTLLRALKYVNKRHSRTPLIFAMIMVILSSLLLITAGVLLMSSLMRCDYNHVKTYSITENNAVGPTTSLTLRTLDNPTPDDTNAIWLAMNGNDSNPGTQAQPVLTFGQAMTL